jgi:tetratricopeptide (TPR) repeat protein
VIKKALAKNPEERYQSCRAMMADLEDPGKFAEATRAYGPGAEEPRNVPSVKRNGIALAGGLLVFGLLAGIGYKVLSRGEGKAGAGAPGLKPVKQEVINPATRSAAPISAATGVSSADENLAKLKSSFERRSFQETIELAQKMLNEDPTNAPAREYRDKAREAQIAEHVRPILGKGIASFNSGDYQACITDMEEVLKLNKNNPEARSYIFQADQAVSKKELLKMREQYRIAEESKDWPAISSLISPALASEVRSKYREWFNRYDGITSRILNDNVPVIADDLSSAKLTFSQMVYAINKKDKKKEMLFEGLLLWELKKVNGTWKIINIFRPSTG